MQGVAQTVVIGVLFADFGVTRRAVGKHGNHVVGAHIAVHGNHVEGGSGHVAQRFLQQRRGNGGIGGDEAEHGVHVRLDHTRAFGDDAEAHAFTAQTGFRRPGLHAGIGGHDGFRYGAAVRGGKRHRCRVDAGAQDIHRQPFADDTGGSHYHFIGPAAEAGGGISGGIAGIIHPGCAGTDARIDDDRPCPAIRHGFARHHNRCRRHPVLCKNRCHRRRTVGNNQGDIFFTAFLDAGADPGSAETLREDHAGLHIVVRRKHGNSCGDGSGIERDGVKGGIFGEAAGDIEILHRLPRRPLDQIVNGRKHDNPSRTRVEMPADIAEIRAAYRLRRRIAVSSALTSGRNAA